MMAHSQEKWLPTGWNPKAIESEVMRKCSYINTAATAWCASRNAVLKGTSIAPKTARRVGAQDFPLHPTGRFGIPFPDLNYSEMGAA